jgi:hypothetical protein
MRVVAEFEIYCDALPLVEAAATVPEATIPLELQFNLHSAASASRVVTAP